MFRVAIYILSQYLFCTTRLLIVCPSPQHMKIIVISEWLNTSPAVRKTLQNRKITSVLQMETWGTDKLNDLPTVTWAVPAETETDPIAFLPQAEP